jgi:hypothetical protein
MSASLAEEHATEADLELLVMDRLQVEQAYRIGVHLVRCGTCRERLADQIVRIAEIRSSLEEG